MIATCSRTFSKKDFRKEATIHKVIHQTTTATTAISMELEGSTTKKRTEDAAQTEDQVSSLFPNEVLEKLVHNIPHRAQCRFQVASRGFRTLIKAVQRSQNKWPEFMKAVEKRAPKKYGEIYNTLAQFDEKARVVDRSNNYYWYQKCPICMQSKEMDIVKETGSAMTMKCSLCQGAYGCAILWTYSFNTIPCAECNEKRPKGFTCSNCKQTYCQDCKFHLRAGNAYGWNNVCCRCVRDCGHGCDWAYVVGNAEKCTGCNQKLCARCAEWGSDCLQSGSEEDDEDDSEEGDDDDDDIDEDEEEDENDEEMEEQSHD